VVDEARLADEILFDTLEVSPASCAVAEACVNGTGLRRLLRFSVQAVNQGQADLRVPPPSNRPDLFDYSECHGHYHFQGFARYELLDGAGNVVLTGRKQAYCMEDTERVADGPGVACDKKYDCSNQGIQAGWSDIYGNALDCQWLDITGLPAGDYALRVSVNPSRVPSAQPIAGFAPGTGVGFSQVKGPLLTLSSVTRTCRSYRWRPSRGSWPWASWWWAMFSMPFCKESL